MLAGVLKIVMASLPVSWYGDMFYMLGFPLPGGPLEALTMIPFGLGLMLLARYLQQHGFDKKRWFARAIFAGSVIALLLGHVVVGSKQIVRRAMPRAPPTGESRLVQRP